MKNLVFLCLFILAGCSSKQSESFIYGKTTSNINSVIAVDIAEYVSNEYKGIDNTIQIIHADVEFDNLLIEQLRSHGFSIADREDVDIHLSYKIKIVEDIYYLQFKLNNTYLSKSYSDEDTASNWTKLEVE